MGVQGKVEVEVEVEMKVIVEVEELRVEAARMFHLGWRPSSRRVEVLASALTTLLVREVRLQVEVREVMVGGDEDRNGDVTGGAGDAGAGDAEDTMVDLSENDGEDAYGGEDDYGARPPGEVGDHLVGLRAVALLLYTGG